MNERDTSAADLAIDEIVPQGTSEPAIQMISMATEAQDPHIDIPDPPTESSSHQSKKRKRPTPKDPGKYKHECDTCGERFTRSTTLREHKRIHTNERPFACSTCLKTFTRPKDRKRHQELHTRKNKFSCDLSFDGIDGQCGRAFAREDGLVAHLRTERGWHCLQSIFSSEFLGMVAQRDARNENVFRCELTRLSCGAEFDRFVDLKKHLGEPDNKQCVVERLVKIFVDRIRSDQERECAEQKERSSTTSDSEQQRPSSPKQQSLQSQRETSPPRPPSLAVTRSEQNKLQEPLTSVENIVECVSSFGSPTEEAAREEAIKGPTPSVGLIPAREVGPDFDPFAGLVLVNSGCDSLGSSLLVWIDIKCSQHLTTNYRVGIGRDTDMSTRLIRGEFSSYRLEACFHSVEYDLVNSLEIYICYQSDGSPPRIFRVGRVRYELMVNGWKWVKVTSPAVSADIRSEHEIPERGVTEVENAPPSFLGDIHTLQEGSKIEEVAIPRKPVGPSPQESELNTVYDRFSGWILIDSSFVEAESKIWLRIESPKPLATPPYFRMRTSTETFFEMAQCERDKRLISTCRYVFVMKISGHWFRRKFLEKEVRIDLVYHPTGTGKNGFAVGTLYYVSKEDRWKWVGAPSARAPAIAGLGHGNSEVAEKS